MYVHDRQCLVTWGTRSLRTQCMGSALKAVTPPWTGPGILLIFRVLAFWWQDLLFASDESKGHWYLVWVFWTVEYCFLIMIVNENRVNGNLKTYYYITITLSVAMQSCCPGAKTVDQIRWLKRNAFEHGYAIWVATTMFRVANVKCPGTLIRCRFDLIRLFFCFTLQYVFFSCDGLLDC